MRQAPKPKHSSSMLHMSTSASSPSDVRTNRESQFVPSEMDAAHGRGRRGVLNNRCLVPPLGRSPVNTRTYARTDTHSHARAKLNQDAYAKTPIVKLHSCTHLETMAVFPDSGSPKKRNFTMLPPRLFVVGLFSANFCAREFALFRDCDAAESIRGPDSRAGGAHLRERVNNTVGTNTF